MKDNIDSIDRDFANVKDLKNDKLVMWQHRNIHKIAVFVGMILPAIIGYFLGSALGGFALAGLLRIVFVHHATFFINSLCHYKGSQPYSDSHSAKDSGLVALFTFGEGYHNFHHEFQADYRNGIYWYQFDPAKWLIKTLSFFKMAKKLRVTPESQILKAKMIMKEKKKNLDSQFDENLQALRDAFIQAYTKWQKLKQEYYKLKKNHSLPEISLDDLKAQMKLAKKEFKLMKKKWEFELAKLSMQQA